MFRRQLVALVVGVAVACTQEIMAADLPRVIDVGSTFPSSMALIGESAGTLGVNIARASKGQLRLVVHEPGDLVAAADTVDAIADGRLTAAWAGAGWFAKRDSAFNMFSTVPFRPDIGEYLA